MKDNNLKKHEWTEKQAKSAHTPNFGKKYIGEPELLRMFGNVKNKKVLELGSGNGYWLDLLSRHGAIGTGVELEKKQLELADKSNHRTTYIQGDITKLEKLNLQKNSFDFVLLEHVLLEISSLKKINKIMTDAFGLLKKSGVIIISEIHP
ncbi:MAG TPA: class I SAM-dependent methyltransferase, partial [Patescibacteria group bacterium]